MYIDSLILVCHVTYKTKFNIHRLIIKLWTAWWTFCSHSRWGRIIFMCFNHLFVRLAGHFWLFQQQLSAKTNQDHICVSEFNLFKVRSITSLMQRPSKKMSTLVSFKIVCIHGPNNINDTYLFCWTLHSWKSPKSKSYFFIFLCVHQSKIWTFDCNICIFTCTITSSRSGI